jgi:hypothetical protein
VSAGTDIRPLRKQVTVKRDGTVVLAQVIGRVEKSGGHHLFDPIFWEAEDADGEHVTGGEWTRQDAVDELLRKVVAS